MSDNKYGIDLLKYYMYMFEAENLHIEDSFKSTINTKSTSEAFALMMIMMLKYMYEEGQLYEGYSDLQAVELPYICGEIDIQRSIDTGSFTRNEAWQTIRVKSINIDVNLAIKYSIDTILTYKNIRACPEFCNKVNAIMYTDKSAIFRGSKPFKYNKKLTEHYLGVIYKCLSSDFYTPYIRILNICKLYLKSLYEAKSVDDLDNSKLSMFNCELWKVMEAFLQTAFRHVMLSLSNDERYKSKFVKKWHMRKSDREFKASGKRIEILVSYDKNCEFQHLLVDCKTNDVICSKSGEYLCDDNRNQIQVYVDEYKRVDSSMKYGILFHFLKEETRQLNKRLNNKQIGTDTDKNMYIWTCFLKPDTKPREVEAEIRERILELYHLN